jgi:hypothetical protein
LKLRRFPRLRSDRGVTGGGVTALLLHDPINSAFFDAQLPSLGFAVSIKILKSLAMKMRFDGFAHELLGSAFLARRNLPNA